MPVANNGQTGGALALLGKLTQLLQSIVLPQLPVGSDAARDVREGINKFAKHVPQGPSSEGVMTTAQQKMMLEQRQQGPQIAAMRAAQPPGDPSRAAPPMAA